jgi:putative ABC transport system ATP-binding protein
VFQGFNLFPALTALENVAIAIKMKDPGRATPTPRRDGSCRGRPGQPHAPQAGRSVGRPEAARRDRPRPGGDPAIIVGDEPTAALDTKTALDVMALLRSLASEHGRAVVVVTHDPRLERFADRVARVEDGAIQSIDRSTP